MSQRPTLPHTDEAAQEFQGVRESLHLWWRDFDRAIEYVEPVDEHGPVYSHRFFELLLRAATEFESLAKTYAQLSDNNLAERPNINHYRDLLRPLHVDQAAVGVRQWRPKPTIVKPFEIWADGGEGAPEWYRGYNEVKHSRRAEFGKASLLNAVTAAAGVFAALMMVYDYPHGLWPRATRTRLDPTLRGREVVRLFFQESPFYLIVPSGVLQ